MKKRLLYYEIEKYLNHKNALVITGMRQVGKTVLMRQLFESISSPYKLWFDFDNPLDQKMFEDTEYRNIYLRLQEAAGAKNERLTVCVDEIQNFPEITKIIKFLIDHYNVKFIVTGSSNFYLKNLFPESLSGRKFLYELWPLSFQEYLYFNDQISLEEALRHDLSAALRAPELIQCVKRDEYYKAYEEFGGFPEVVTTKDIPTKEHILKNIFTSFFEKDLNILSDYKDIRELRDLILLLVPRVGSMLEISRLASELGVDRVKIYHYLAFLQGTFFIRLLPKFSKSIDRTVAGGKKVYFSDTGILNSIGKVNDAQLFENAVVNQLSRYGEVSFYYKKNTAEIDAIVNKEIAFEIKLHATPRDLHRLEKLSQNVPVKNYFLISRTCKEQERTLFPTHL